MGRREAGSGGEGDTQGGTTTEGQSPQGQLSKKKDDSLGLVTLSRTLKVCSANKQISLKVETITTYHLTTKSRQNRSRR
jgi:hypothetical protein